MAQVNEQGQLNAHPINSVQPSKRFRLKELGKLWRVYNYHLYCQVTECEIKEKMEENMPDE